jgi:hypothetical protein
MLCSNSCESGGGSKMAKIVTAEGLGDYPKLSSSTIYALVRDPQLQDREVMAIR